MKVSSLPHSVLEAAHRTQLLDTPPEEAYDRLTRLASRLVGTPVALVTVLDEDRQFFKSAQGLAEPWKTRRETPLTHSFCQHVAITRQPLVIEDARKHPLVKDNRAIPELGVVAYLGVPLQRSGEDPFGVLCTIDEAPHRWSDDDIETLRELGELVVAQVDLQLMARQLNELCERQSEFIGIAAHDLRNPLTVIMGYSRFLQSDRAQVGDKERPMVDSIVNSSRYMLTLVENLLDLEALKAGRLRLETATFDLADLLQRVALQHQPIVESEGIKLELDAPSTEFRGDRAKLEQVINNLLGNAIKHSPAGSTIRLELGREGRHTFIRVRDQGSGMDQETLQTIFQPFTRGKEKKQRGAGLGLAIVESIVKAHGGRIDVESSPGKGSVFSVYLPGE